MLEKSGHYVLTSPAREARLTLVKGAIDEVLVDGLPRADRREALVSLFDWAGTVELVVPDERRAPQGELLSVDDVLT